MTDNWKGSGLTSAEAEVMGHLADAARIFAALTPAHPSDGAEFYTAIHAAQNIVLSRPAMMRRFT